MRSFTSHPLVPSPLTHSHSPLTHPRTQVTRPFVCPAGACRTPAAVPPLPATGVSVRDGARALDARQVHASADPDPHRCGARRHAIWMRGTCVVLSYSLSPHCPPRCRLTALVAAVSSLAWSHSAVIPRHAADSARAPAAAPRTSTRAGTCRWETPLPRTH
jgi:hypothetical protein